MTIITIREAAWLTDNTYRYDEVVCMMGEIVSALHGEIQVCDGNHATIPMVVYCSLQLCK